ncbi:ABC transporter permease [Halorussus sp. MSC15.2]|uniref:ABC transporter permease n=1 Tax=Halorussus sp. MSC15.2 TaxID=2283638 RepID=UPI0013CFC740|nr:ABC transporter permease [Halorussus sp. MSC15.2]NEU56337.1 ABC transporter permease [Halorussus sp. MSC15.2]
MDDGDGADDGVASEGASVGDRFTAFGVGAGCLGLGFAVDLFVRGEGEPLALGFDPSGLDWLFALSWLALATFVVWPLAARPRMTRTYWNRLRTNRLAVASLAYLVVFLVVGTVGPWFLRPELNLDHAHQPPMFFGVAEGRVYECLGPVVDGWCRGTLRYPLGTNSTGKSVVALLVSGMRVSLLVALVSATILVPVGVAIGVVAGYAGGWTDTLLMGYVDVQQTLPAFVLYLILVFLFEKGLLLVVLVFGLTSWGGTARMVRSEVLQRRKEGYVTAARNAGASHWHVLRKHLLPNVSSTVVTATSRQIPLFLLTEAAIAYLELNDFLLMSWGEIIALELRKEFPATWWTSTFAVSLLAVTILSFSVLGDALRDVLDPKESA